MINKRLLGIAAIVFLLIIGGVVYFIVRGKENPPAGERFSVREISGELMAWPVLSQDEKSILYYNRQISPGFYKYNLQDGSKEQLWLADDINEVKWSPDRAKVIIKVIYNGSRFTQYNSPFLLTDAIDGQTIFFLYDFSRHSLQRLTNAYSAIWSADGASLIYTYYDSTTKVSKIKITDADNKVLKGVINIDCLACRLLYYSSRAQKLFFVKNLTDHSAITLQINLVNNSVETVANNLAQLQFTLNQNRYVIYDTITKSLAVRDFSGRLIRELGGEYRIEQLAWSPDGRFVWAMVKNKLIKLNIDINTQQEFKVKNWPEEQDDIDHLIITRDGSKLYFTAGGALHQIEL